MEEIKSEEKEKEKNNFQKSYQINSEINQSSNKYISILDEKEISLWLQKLNLGEEILKELEKFIKNGKDLISIYNNSKILETINLDFHSNNVIINAIEEGLEEQLKVNIILEKGKNIFLNIENEPKYKLKEIISFLEKFFKKPIYLTPLNNENEILSPNTLIVKKILLNPIKYCNLKLFDNKSILSNNNNNIDSIISPKLDNLVNDTNKNKIEISQINNENISNNNNINQNNSNKNINLINTNNTKIGNITKAYVSLFQDKKNNLPNFTTDYQMPSQNRSNGNNNFIDSETNKNISSKPIEDFKYHNILSKKEREEKEDNNFMNEIKFTNDNKNNEAKNIGFKNITNFNNIGINENDKNNINKNYLTQRNFNSKTISNNDTSNYMMIQQILNKKRSEKNLSSGIPGRNTIANLEENNNLSFLEKNKREKEKENINFNFINKENNNEIKKQINKKTENRYEFNRFNDFDKDNNFGNNNNLFNLPKTKTIPENNDINNLIINNQNEELNNSKEKIGINNNLNKDSENDILKVLREKYSLQGNNDNRDYSDNNRFNGEFKPKTPINEGRRNINNENFRFTDDNSNNPLEHKFLMQQNNDFIQLNNNYLKKENQKIFNPQKDDDNNNFLGKFKNENNVIGKNRMNRPSSGLELNSFQYKATDYKSSFSQNQNIDLNDQFKQNDE